MPQGTVKNSRSIPPLANRAAVETILLDHPRVPDGLQVTIAASTIGPRIAWPCHEASSHNWAVATVFAMLNNNNNTHDNHSTHIVKYRC
jgi:hypothetical protein